MRKKIVSKNKISAAANLNEMVPVVLLSKKTRASVGTTIKGFVSLKFGKQDITAMVHPTFREFIGKDSAILNNLAMKKLKIKITESGDIVSRTKTVAISKTDKTIKPRTMSPSDILGQVMRRM